MQTTVNKVTHYEGEHLTNIAYPLGGLGAGMFCLEGTGALSHFSLRHKPNLADEPNIFAALAIKDGQQVTARVLEGPVPRKKIWSTPNTKAFQGAGSGLSGRNYGLPRFRQCTFHARFPFAHIDLADPALPLTAAITAWSPFIPGDEDHSGLPAATLEYTLTHSGPRPLDCVFYFAGVNMLGLGNQLDSVTPSENGFTFHQAASPDKPWEEAHFRVTTDQPDTYTDTAWFRGGWFDAFTMVWNQIKTASYQNKRFDEPDARSMGGTLAVPLTLQPGETKTVKLHFTWYAPASDQRHGDDLKDAHGNVCTPGTYKAWYTAQFDSLDAVTAYYHDRVDNLRAQTALFTDTLWASTLPDALMDAINANLSILKSPTVLRTHDGRLWCWEGSHDFDGSCHGSCTHVWNYAQAICHLFPKLERSLRHTEFNENQDERGHQTFRASLPIRPAGHGFHAAADGQLGGIMKTYRDWRISGDTAWMKALWPQVKQSLAYCTNAWDPNREGVVREPHHNTYDIEFYGVEPMCTTFYLGALAAAAQMATAVGETEQAAAYEALREKGAKYLVTHLFNGEYLYQDIPREYIDGDKEALTAMNDHVSPEAVALMRQEGPKYQYGTGCLSDGVIGAWMASLYGLGDVMDSAPVRSHLRSIFTYNLKEDLSEHANTQRPNYAFGHDGGLLLCTWPRGGKLSLPFVYSDEVWTGIEYQVASHLMLEGFVEEGIKIVEVLRKRYNGADRNPFNEYECGNWYARALASYALLQSYAGVRYDKVSRTLYIQPAVPGDTTALLSFDGGYGLAGVKDGKPFYQPVVGDWGVDHIEYVAKA